MKVLNLYAGIGGNRKLWSKECEVTAIERDYDIAKIYQDFFPEDKVIVADAHQYLLEHYKEFDFIWSSPPCQTHSRMRFLKMEQNCKPKYPEMRLYEEILFLKTWFKGMWVIENVISYYKPLIKPYESGNHYFWSNFHILPFEKEFRGLIRLQEHESLEFKEEMYGFDLSKFDELSTRFKKTILGNCVHPKLGLHIFNCAFKEKQQILNGL